MARIRTTTGGLILAENWLEQHAAGEQRQRRADPGEECPFVGERKPVVRLLALLTPRWFAHVRFPCNGLGRNPAIVTCIFVAVDFITASPATILFIQSRALRLTQSQGTTIMNLADDLQKLHTLREQGALTEDEFAQAKKRLLEGTAEDPPPKTEPPKQPGSALNQLRRSLTDRWIGGVSGGLADVTGIPSWTWRILFVLTALLHGLGLIIYILLWIFVPAETASKPATSKPPEPLKADRLHAHRKRRPARAFFIQGQSAHSRSFIRGRSRHSRSTALPVPLTGTIRPRLVK
jgi:phage shock protein PspC (stress-responsive transcriptional regulator)